ncbi:MAG: YicC/YloC family endoribonuclease, partial [Pseudomonadota bacterium]
MGEARVSSMTGFARTSGSAAWGSWVWEAKSVNHKGLDIRLNLPQGADRIERPLRQVIQERLTRGSVQMALRLDIDSADSGLAVDEQALEEVVQTYARREGEPPTGSVLAQLMAIRGIVNPTDGQTNLKELLQQDEVVKSIYDNSLECLGHLIEDRHKEGAQLRELLVGHLNEVDRLREDALGHAAQQPSAVREKFVTRLKALEADQLLDEDRIAVEAAALAAKADVTEELDRLSAHIVSGFDLIQQGVAIGRQLGFLSQELNREANTLCSKSALVALTQTGLALKTVI